MLGVHGFRLLRVHGLGCWEKLAIDVPIREGSLVVFGGPLKERWLYWHMCDKEVRGERVVITLQLHADVDDNVVRGLQQEHTCNLDAAKGYEKAEYRSTVEDKIE